MSSCLGCGISVPPGTQARRLINSSVNSHILETWLDLVAEKVDHREVAIVRQTALACGFLCKQCFALLKHYHDCQAKLLELKQKLQDNLSEAWKCINFNPLDQAEIEYGILPDRSEQSSDPASLLGKHAHEAEQLKENDPQAKRPRISSIFAPSIGPSSPGVEVMFIVHAPM